MSSTSLAKILKQGAIEASVERGMDSGSLPSIEGRRAGTGKGCPSVLKT